MNTASKILLLASVGVGFWYMNKSVQQPELRHFSPSEFGVWYPFMDKKLLLALDDLRAHWGRPIAISGAIGALGREDGNQSSWHFPRNGIVHAADVMPYTDGRGLNDSELTELYYIARSMNVFSGIGVYPDWQPRAGLHLDTRTDRDAVHNPALWGAINVNGKQEYVSINQVLVG